MSRLLSLRRDRELTIVGLIYLHTIRSLLWMNTLSCLIMFMALSSSKIMMNNRTLQATSLRRIECRTYHPKQILSRQLFDLSNHRVLRQYMNLCHHWIFLGSLVFTSILFVTTKIFTASDNIFVITLKIGNKMNCIKIENHLHADWRRGFTDVATQQPVGLDGRRTASGPRSCRARCGACRPRAGPRPAGCRGADSPR